MDIKDFLTEKQYKELYKEYQILFKNTDITFEDFLTKTYQFSNNKNINKMANLKKTLTIDNPKHVADGMRLYLTEGRKYAVTGYGNRWWIIDIERNFESSWEFISKFESLQTANRFEKQQIEEGFENDNDIWDANNVNVEYRECFGINDFNHRYNPK